MYKGNCIQNLKFKLLLYIFKNCATPSLFYLIYFYTNKLLQANFIMLDRCITNGTPFLDMLDYKLFVKSVM